MSKKGGEWVSKGLLTVKEKQESIDVNGCLDTVVQCCRVGVAGPAVKIHGQELLLGLLRLKVPVGGVKVVELGADLVGLWMALDGKVRLDWPIRGLVMAIGECHDYSLGLKVVIATEETGIQRRNLVQKAGLLMPFQVCPACYT